MLAQMISREFEDSGIKTVLTLLFHLNTYKWEFKNWNMI